MKKIFLFFILISVFAINSRSQTAKLQSVFIYNFIKYMEWPDSYQTGDFVIGVLGNSAIVSSLNSMAKHKKTFGSQPIRIKVFHSPSQIQKCHILFIPKKNTAKIRQAVNKIGANSTVIITEDENMLSKGATINFVIRNNRQRFELSRENAAKQKVKVSGYLVKLANKG